MSPSQGLKIDIESGNIELVKAVLKEEERKANAPKPRFAVMLEYMHYGKKREPLVYFGHNVDDLNDQSFVVKFDEDTNMPEERRFYQAITEIRVHMVDGSNLGYQSYISVPIENGKIKVSADTNKKVKEDMVFKRMMSKLELADDISAITYYLSVHFDDKLKKFPEYEDYDFKSPWCFPVTFWTMAYDCRQLLAKVQNSIKPVHKLKGSGEIRKTRYCVGPVYENGEPIFSTTSAGKPYFWSTEDSKPIFEIAFAEDSTSSQEYLMVERMYFQRSMEIPTPKIYEDLGDNFSKEYFNDKNN